MTIHSDHPFLPPEHERSPVRRLRGRMPAPVTVWASAAGPNRAGWTVSSLMIADGDPPQLLGLLDEDSDLADLLLRTRTVAVSLLGWGHRGMADAFAGTAPAPGGPFRMGSWDDTDWGPVLADGLGWIGARLLPGAPDHAGWGLLIRAAIEHAEVSDASPAPVLAHLRGRYVQLGTS